MGLPDLTESILFKLAQTIAFKGLPDEPIKAVNRPPRPSSTISFDFTYIRICHLLVQAQRDGHTQGKANLVVRQSLLN